MNDFNIKKFLTENKMTRNSRLLNEESTYQFSEYDFDIKKNPEFYSKVVEIVKNNSDMTDEEIDAKIEAATDYHYGEARKANKNSREYPSMTAEEFAQSVTKNSENLNEEASNEVEVVDMDNRDASTTELTLSNDITVEVDVIDLFLNMVENLGSDELESEAEALIAKIKNI